MLKRSFFCTFLLLVVYHASYCNLSLVFVGYYFIHSSRENCFNCTELIELSPLVVSYLVNKIRNRVSPNFRQNVSEINVNCFGGGNALNTETNFHTWLWLRSLME